MKNKLLSLLKTETVFMISGLAAILSALFIPPSNEYFNYIDFNVIALLFCLMVVVAGLSTIGTFEVLSQKLLRVGNSVRFISLILVTLCFFIAMLVTNDVALITMVPFTLSALDFLSEKRLIFIVVMETIAANLGSMLTPIGNPQNLYLFSFFQLDIIQFLKVTLPVTSICFILIVLLTGVVRGQKLNIVFDVETKIENKYKLLIYSLLFCICILTVLGFVSYIIMFIFVTCTTLIIDRKLFGKIDYFLLLTFVFFFIFVGNISHITIVSSFISKIIEGRELLASVMLSQVISNVPTAVMLSSFTKNYEALIIGTDIGGLGTLVASLASLISFKFYSQRKNADKNRYVFMFSVINILFLIILVPFCYKLLS